MNTSSPGISVSLYNHFRPRTHNCEGKEEEGDNDIITMAGGGGGGGGGGWWW
jgi:hypothetical protein